MTSKRYEKKQGFTLIELLLVISLIAILSGFLFVVMNPGGVRSKMRDNTRITDLGMIQNALEQYFVDHRNYPVNAVDWLNVSTVLQGPLVTTGRYIQQLPSDPNGGVYYYKSSSAGAFYALVAFMENATSNDKSLCTNLDSFTTLSPFPDSTYPGYTAECFGVESPTVLR